MEAPAAPEATRASSQSNRSKLSQSWWQFTLGGAVAPILGIGFLWALMLFAWPLALLVLGLSIATALAPAVGWLERWLPRVAAILIVYLILLLILIGIGWIVFPPLVAQAQDAAERLPQLIEQGRERLNQFSPWERTAVCCDTKMYQNSILYVYRDTLLLPLFFISTLPMKFLYT